MPVGKGQSNLPDDVKLVEALIESVTRVWPPDSLKRAAEAVKAAIPQKLGLSGNDLKTMHGKNVYVLWILQLCALKASGPEEFMSLRTRLGLNYEAIIDGNTLRF